MAHLSTLLLTVLGLQSAYSLSSSFALLGGSGRIGTAVASHLLLREPKSKIVLVGRSNDKLEKAVREVLSERPGSDLTYEVIDDVWVSDTKLNDLLRTVDCCIHTAGPYLDRAPVPLEAAIDAKCKVYVDVGDPIAYLENCLLLNHTAPPHTTALVAAGAFPGMSNVLATEAASQLSRGTVQNIIFQYFTAGLGGSGPLNLYITNLGFGEPMVQFDQGALRFFPFLSGQLLGNVDFFLPVDNGFGNHEARERVGTRQVFAWPFPEAATVPTLLRARGSSIACMGTAPDLWNTMLGLLVQLIPRQAWRNQRFSQFMADFSQPMVWLTDQILKTTDPQRVGETHAMRIDVTSRDGKTFTIIQAHDSFRRCVAQSCAEFALDCLQNPRPGVYLPEQRYEDSVERKRMVEKLTSTPGTFCYTGPVSSHTSGPTLVEEAIRKAELMERQLL